MQFRIQDWIWKAETRWSFLFIDVSHPNCLEAGDRQIVTRLELARSGWDILIPHGASVKDYNGFSMRNWWIVNFQSCRNLHWQRWQSLPCLLRLNEVSSGNFLCINNMLRHVLTTFRSKLLPEIVGPDQMCIALYKSELFMEWSTCFGRNVFGVSLEDFSDRENFVYSSWYISRY